MTLTKDQIEEINNITFEEQRELIERSINALTEDEKEELRSFHSLKD